jgi:hypothetical protein
MVEGDIIVLFKYLLEVLLTAIEWQVLSLCQIPILMHQFMIQIPRIQENSLRFNDPRYLNVQ